MNEKSFNYFVFWKEEDKDAIREWRTRLDEEKGERAQLRRCESPEQVLTSPAFHRLLMKFPQGRFTDQTLGLAAAAGLMSRVDDTPIVDGKPVTFARQLGMPKKEGRKPVMSELRFTQLQKCEDLDELYRKLRRAIQLLDRRANLVSLADCVLQWEREQRGKHRLGPAKSLKFRMANDYYTAVMETESKK